VPGNLSFLKVARLEGEITLPPVVAVGVCGGVVGVCGGVVGVLGVGEVGEEGEEVVFSVEGLPFVGVSGDAEEGEG